MTTTISLEAWSSTVVALNARQAALIAGAGLARVEPTADTGRWRIACDAHVGVVADGRWQLHVQPRLRVPQLLFLLGYATDPRGWREAPAHFEQARELLPAVAHGFAVQAERALARGLVRGYVTVEEQATTMRGRLRVADQLARRPGLPLPLELAYDDHSVDVPENRLLHGAAAQLLRLPRLPAATRLRLRRLTAVLHEARPTAPGPTVVSPAITRLNAHCAGALGLGERILRGLSISARGGDVASATFVFDMNEVFEQFLTTALRSALERRGGRVLSQRATRLHLDTSGQVRLVPDLTWWRDGRCRAVVDAKYKRLEGGRGPNADLYQLLAYCTALGLPRGWLVYAAGAAEPAHHRIVRSGIELVVAGVDVARPPRELLGQVERLAREISRASPQQS